MLKENVGWRKDGGRRHSWTMISQSVTITYPGHAPDPPTQNVGQSKESAFLINPCGNSCILATLRLCDYRALGQKTKCPSVALSLSIQDFALHPSSRKDLCISPVCVRSFYSRPIPLMTECRGSKSKIHRQMSGRNPPPHKKKHVVSGSCLSLWTPEGREPYISGIKPPPFVGKGAGQPGDTPISPLRRRLPVCPDCKRTNTLLT